MPKVKPGTALRAKAKTSAVLLLSTTVDIFILFQFIFSDAFIRL